MKKEKKYIVILVIFILAILASGILSFVSIEQACGGTQTGCYAVNTSQYEKTLGIKNGYIGLVVFSILAIITSLHIRNPSKSKKRIIITGIILGTLFALYFLYIQFFVLKAICKYCMVIDLGMLINLGIIMFWKDTEDLNSLKWTN
jgi:uncharacterized membrane protein